MKVYPAALMDKVPAGLEISPAMKRLYEVWPVPDDRYNDFFTNFKYSRLKGLSTSSNVSRRDPSKVIKVEDTYYVYYTRRKTELEPRGVVPEQCSENEPIFDWDLSDIYCASSKDGFEWTELGVSVLRTPEVERSLSNPDILIWEGKYYMYYQVYSMDTKVLKENSCNIAMAYADHPTGPWIKVESAVLTKGEKGQWDSGSVFDPYPIVYKGKIWMYYGGSDFSKGDDWNTVRMQGVAIADSPKGPFEKHELNPLTNSGRETFLYPYKEGIVTVLTFDGIEKNTIQYAKDGLNFEIMSYIHCPPIAAGVYSPECYLDNVEPHGVTWGLCHIEKGELKENCMSQLIRFDCDLDSRIKRQYFRDPDEYHGRYSEETYFSEKMLL